MSLKIVFILANNADHNEMSHYAASLFEKVPVYQYPKWKGLVEIIIYSKSCVKRTLRNRQNKDLNDKW